jgi:prepilin-type N-terminal cleavage/methylation domain-containing protein
MAAPSCFSKTTGFTLIELSIVLVIIGLIIGGVLLGQDLISAATVRAQISQIEKYNTAVNTFQGKYGYLPGDIPDPYASQFGFGGRGPYPGEGDGNGVLEGIWGPWNGGGTDSGWYQIGGETVMFWVDLSTAGLLDGGFSTASATTAPSSDITPASTPSIGAYLPQAKLGNGSYVYVWSPSIYQSDGVGSTGNYYGVSSIPLLNNAFALPNTSPSLTVAAAYAIDKKIDDGYPLTGSVVAYALAFPGAALLNYEVGISLPDTVQTPGSPTTCFDNDNVSGGQQQYSLGQNNGAGVNCTMSFQFH